MNLVKNGSIYANQNGVFVYQEPDTLTRFQNIRYNRDDPEFNADELIGVYLGETQVSGGETFIKVKWIHRYVIYDGLRWLVRRDKLDEKGNGEEFLTGWVKESQIATTTTSSNAKEAEELLKKKIEEAEKAAGASTDPNKAATSYTKYLWLLLIPLAILAWQQYKKRKI